jgi:serine/threonine protein kinase/WD40 repeat protein
VDAFCDAFEAAWLAGHQPRIEDFLLRGDPAHQDALLQELLLAEWDLCQEHGPPAELPAYLARFPESQQAITDLWRIWNEEHADSRADVSNVATGTTIEDALREVPGTVIDRYTLLEKLGEGGFGLVFVAEQQHPVRRKVALKIIKPGMDTRQVVARFEAERQALALMDHANIAKVFDAGSTETGRPYFVMELVRGIPITEYCDGERLSTRDRLDLFMKVCYAIQHAHQKGIIHRDIKPSNILVTLHDGVPIPKVIDFGVAKAIQQKLTEKTIYTQLAQFIGTPAYMSPEQAEMTGLDIDTRSDIYSLGVLLYELLTGVTPFDAKELMRSGLDAMRKIIREREPLTPSSRLSKDTKAKSANAEHSALRIPHSAFDRDLDWIVMKCLEKDRNRRYETAGSLAADIARYLNNEPVEARPPSKVYRFRKFAQKHRAGIAIAIAFAAILVAATAVSIWQRRQAELREAETRRQAYAADMSLAQLAVVENRIGGARSLLNSHRPQAGQEDLRGWEWRYLWQYAQGNASHRLCQSSSLVCSLSVSHDGKWLAVGEANKSGVSVWDLGSRREVAHWPAGDAEVLAAFSPTSPLLAFSSLSGPPANRLAKVQLWDANKREIVGEIPLGARCRALVFAADGQTLVTATEAPDPRIALWKVPEGAPLASFEKNVGGHWHNQAIPLAVTPDLKLAAYSSSDANVYVIDLATGVERWSEKATDEIVTALAFTPDGSTLATGAGWQESAIRLWDVASRVTRRLEGHELGIGALLFSSDGKRLYSASWDQTIQVWDLGDVSQTTPSRVLRGHDVCVSQLALLPDDQTLVSASEDGVVYVWDTPSDDQRQSDGPVYTDIIAGGFTPDSRSVVNLNAQGEVKRWSGPDFDQVESEFNVGGEFDRGGALISPDCRWLAIRRNDGAFEVWDVHRRLVHRRLPTKSERAWAFFANGTRLVTLEKGTALMHVWDLTSGVRTEPWRRAIFPDRDFQPGAISPDDRWCLTIGRDGSGILRDIFGQRDVDPQLNAREPHGVAFSAKSSLIAVTSGNGARYTRIWNTADKLEVASLGEGGNCVAFSPDDRRVAIGWADADAVTVWDLASRRQLVALSAKGTAIVGVCFSPDGNVIAAANPRGDVYLWRAPTFEEIAAAEARQQKKGAELVQ